MITMIEPCTRQLTMNSSDIKDKITILTSVKAVHCPHWRLDFLSNATFWTDWTDARTLNY